MDITQKEIDRMQTNLQALRKLARWTTEDLGEQIGVTKQTISNLENKKTKMTKTQFLALWSVFNYEVLTNPDNTLLGQVMNLVLESEDDDSSPESVDTSAAGTDNNIQTTTSSSVPTKKKTKPIVKLPTLAAVGAIMTALSLEPLLLDLIDAWIDANRK